MNKKMFLTMLIVVVIILTIIVLMRGNLDENKISGEDIYANLNLSRCTTIYVFSFPMIEDGVLKGKEKMITLNDKNLLHNIVSIIKKSKSISLVDVFPESESHQFQFMIEGDVPKHMKFYIKTNQLVVPYGTVFSDIESWNIKKHYQLVINVDSKFKDIIKEVLK